MGKRIGKFVYDWERECGCSYIRMPDGSTQYTQCEEH